MMDNGILAELRNEYKKARLTSATAGDDPLVFFKQWLEEAIRSDVVEPTAMILGTVSRDGQPSSRTVLLKGVGEDGFLFFTSYASQKGLEISHHPKVSLLFPWFELERQVRVEGIASKVSESVSDEYFLSRPAISQVSAIISPQSKVVPDRDYLESLRDEYLQQHRSGHERPEYWGGYVVKPGKIEFWQGRPGRLHDRILFQWENQSWKKVRLAP